MRVVCGLPGELKNSFDLRFRKDKNYRVSGLVQYLLMSTDGGL